MKHINLNLNLIYITLNAMLMVQEYIENLIRTLDKILKTEKTRGGILLMCLKLHMSMYV